MKSLVIYSDTLMEGDELEVYDGVTGEMYNSYVWQGIRPYFKDYVFVGTATKTDSNIGLVAVGNEALELHSNSKTFGINCLDNVDGCGPALNTSLYGPNVVGKNIFNLVGTYNNLTQINITDPKIYGFYYTGKLKFTKSDLLNPKKYNTIPSYKMGLNITFAHSMSNNHIVLNGGYTTSSIAQSYIYNTTTNEFTHISIPGFKTTTTYGILYENASCKDEIYTLVGGCSNKDVKLSDIYDFSDLQNGKPIPYGNAFILKYNITKKKIDSLRVFQNSSNFIHFQGIWFYKPDIYTIAQDTLSINQKATGYVKLLKCSGKHYFEVESISLPQNSTSNSVANNVVCGIYKESDSFVPYQASF